MGLVTNLQNETKYRKKPKHSLKLTLGLIRTKQKFLGPGQARNVWRLNNIKHADVEVIGQTVKTCLI